MFETLSNCTLQILSMIERAGEEDQDKTEEFLRLIADFARKSRKLFFDKYDKNIDSFLRKLIKFIFDSQLNTYESLTDFF